MENLQITQPEDYTTKHLNTMRKNKDMRRLVVFTIDMGSEDNEVGYTEYYVVIMD